MLPANVELIVERLDEDSLVLDVGGWAGPFRPATHVLDINPYETRGMIDTYGPEPQRFSKETWIQHDICAREPWPYEDDQFDFSLCVMTLEDIRDPIWVCSELSRVSKAGYVEVPSILGELVYAIEGQGPVLGYAHHRWLCEVEDGGLVFMHKPHLIHFNWRLRVLPRQAAQMSLEEHVTALFWEGELTAREEHVIGPPGYPLERWEGIVRERFKPSPFELWFKATRERVAVAAHRALQPLRTAVGRLISRLR